MTAEQAGWCSMQEYRQRIEGKQEEERLAWERGRWQCFMMMRLHPYMKQKPNTPQDWCRFPWENEQPQDIPHDWGVTEDEAGILKELFGNVE